MKTHELAKALNTLARALRAAPNVELDMLALPTGKRVGSADPNDSVALAALVAFSRFDKRQWHELITTLSLPIRVTSSHSARDLMGKIMNYFAENPDARKRLTETAERQPSQASPELMKALATLLKS